MRVSFAFRIEIGWDTEVDRLARGDCEDKSVSCWTPTYHVDGMVGAKIAHPDLSACDEFPEPNPTIITTTGNVKP